MKPIDFPESNKKLLAGDIPDCDDLPVYNDGKITISKWKASLKDRLRILLNGNIYLWVWCGHTSPPVSVSSDYPFITKKENINDR